MRRASIVALLLHAAAALAPSKFSRRKTLLGGAAACAVATVPSRADAIEAASKLPAAKLSGVLYDCRRGLASPASPEALTSMLNKNILGAATASNTRGVLCVSERHDCFDHHLAQLYTIKQLRKALRQREDRAQVAVGLEAFQRIHQTYLDRYVSADPNYGLNELFRDVNWQQTWGYDPLHYAPILEDARRTGMRLVGLSPPDELLDAVSGAGIPHSTSPLWPFLPEGGVCNNNAPGRVERLYGSNADAERLTEIQNFRDEYMADAAARHYDSGHKRDGWLVILAGQRHVANRDGLPDRITRRMARATSTPAHSASVFRGVHTILPETTTFPVKLACLPSASYGDVVWLQPKAADFDPSKVNRAPRPSPKEPARRA